jgi:hypothetical protein
MSTPSRAPRSSDTTRPVAFRSADVGSALIAFVLECAIVICVARGWLPDLAALAAHGVVVALLALRLALVRGVDAGPLLLLVPAVAFMGPFGAFGCLFIGGLSRRGVSDVERLEAWYRRLSLSTELDPTARLADHILTGRALNFSLQPASPMTDLVQNGSIGEKQAILGLVARRFHPDYLPTLQIALVSDEPVIRVQAAAVAAKIRGEMPARVEALLRDASDVTATPERIITRIEEARNCARSGLMESKDRERAERLIDGLLSRTLLRLERSAFNKHMALKGTPSLNALEDHLLATMRHADLRRLRRVQTWANRGPWRWRPLARSSRAGSGRALPGHALPGGAS